MEEIIKRFLQISDGSGYGYGYGSGYGYGDGDGDGSGSGSGYGSGDGDGSGSGSGYGYGSGSGDGYGYGSGSGSGSGSGYGYGSGSDVKSFNNQPVYRIDSIQTLIDSVHGGYARGRILLKDLTTERCYIAKVGNFFAHGKRLHEARRDAQRKYDKNSPMEERIARFVGMYPTLDTKVMGVDLFEWHHTLTGSCEFGRKAFCEERGIEPGKVRMTVREFIELTKNAYGGENIKALAEAYK